VVCEHGQREEPERQQYRAGDAATTVYSRCQLQWELGAGLL
jgi:hypothetical protein